MLFRSRGHLLFLAKHESVERAERARKLLVWALRLRGLLFRGERGRTYRQAAAWLSSSDARALASEVGLDVSVKRQNHSTK